jgi:hypothetical protein
VHPLKFLRASATMRRRVLAVCLWWVCCSCTAVVAVAMAGSGEAGCKKCGWNMQKQGFSFSGGKNRLVAAASQDACEAACCAAGCDAFAYNSAGPVGSQCSIYSDCKPPACKASVWSSGQSAGLSTGCQAGPGGGGGGIDGDVGHRSHLGWVLSGAILGVAAIYLVGGGVFSRGRGGGYIPHSAFWAEVFALVVDGCALVGSYVVAQRRPSSLGANDENAADDAGLHAPINPSRQTSSNRGRRTKLHVAAAMGDVAKLEQLQQDNSKLWGKQLNGGEMAIFDG